jgi:hypothetical protein
VHVAFWLGLLREGDHLEDRRGLEDNIKPEDDRDLRRRSAAARLLAMRVPIPSGAWVCVVCCQVEVSATGRSRIQKSPTECVSLSVIRCSNNPMHMLCVGRGGPTKIILKWFFKK